MAEEILRLGDLLNGHINGEIVNQITSRLTAPGENFGSLMLKVDVTVKNNEKEEILHMVAKCVPLNKEIQKIFNTDITFKNEIGWYKEAIPTLLAFQKEQGVRDVADFFMKIYGARCNLDNGEIVDHGGVILCENLNVRGFKNIDRKVGFNLAQSKEILRILATFHALTLALKQRKPKVFDEKIKRYLHTLSSEHERPGNDIFQPVIEILEDNPTTMPLVLRVVNTIQEVHDSPRIKEPREPWATAIHTDFWVNNIMLNEEEEAPPKVIILDLQTCGFGSPVADVLFFLGTSIENSTAVKHFDDLLKFYYDELISNLKSLKADTMHFSYESFERELEIEAPDQFVHSLFFVAITMAVKGEIADINSIEFDPELELKKMFCNITEGHKEKYAYLVKQFTKRNWI